MKPIGKLIIMNLCILVSAFAFGALVARWNADDSTSLNAASSAVSNGVTINQQAPNFTLEDDKGDLVSLYDYKGKLVVLEWKNHLCPFVKKHYTSNNMQTLQKSVVDQGGIWLSIISSAPGKQGYVTGEESQQVVRDEGSHATAVLLDKRGTVGKLYQAKATPHMVVINKDGNLVYQGAIDSNRSADPADIPISINYISQAVAELEANTPVSVSETRAYGCSIKY